MKTKAFAMLFLALAAASFAQNATPSSIGHPSLRSAKSDDLVESPATNVVKGAFGYVLGVNWDGPIPKDAKTVILKGRQPQPTLGRLGEVTFDVEPKTPFSPFDFVTLFVSTNDNRIAAIAAKTPRMSLAESYTETLEKMNEIAKELVGKLGLGWLQYSVTTNSAFYSMGSYHPSPIIAGKLYREYLKSHPDDPDQVVFTRVVLRGILKCNINLVAGSYFNEKPIINRNTLEEVRRRGNWSRPDYLQTIEQPFNISADYYPYAGDAVINFFVRDVEDRTEHTNLVSVADLKKRVEEEAAKKDEEKLIAPN